MQPLLDTLNINGLAVFINIAGFLLLLVVAQRLVFVPIATLLAERQSDISTTYDQLDADRKQMEALKSDYQQRLATIEAEAREKIQSAIKDAQAARDQILTEANTRSREMITRAEQEVAHEQEQAMITLRQQVVDLALGAANRVIGDSLDETRQRRLIADFIAAPDANFGTSTGLPLSEATPAKTGRRSEDEDLSALEALKPSAAKSAVRSGLRATRRAATGEGGAASGQSASETETSATPDKTEPAAGSEPEKE